MTEQEPKPRGRKPKPAMVEVITVRKIGLPDRTSGVGERVFIPREAAITLQEVGAVKVVL